MRPKNRISENDISRLVRRILNEQPQQSTQPSSYRIPDDQLNNNMLVLVKDNGKILQPRIIDQQGGAGDVPERDYDYIVIGKPGTGAEGTTYACQTSSNPVSCYAAKKVIINKTTNWPEAKKLVGFN